MKEAEEVIKQIEENLKPLANFMEEIEKIFENTESAKTLNGRKQKNEYHGATTTKGNGF